MILDEAQRLLDAMPGFRSNYEFTYLVLEREGSMQRQLRRVLIDKESYSARLQELQLTQALEKYNLSKVEDIIERTLRERIMEAKAIPQKREIENLKAEIARCDAWLANHDPRTLQDLAKDFEGGESEHWTGVLGRRSAIEVLADDKVGVDTMQDLCLLPLEDYRKSVQVMSQFAEFIKVTTTRAESQILPKKPHAVPSEAPQPEPAEPVRDQGIMQESSGTIPTNDSPLS